MSVPNNPLPARFWRVAFQRLEDANVLLNNGRNAAAIYLAGYAAECMLKTLILTALPVGQHEATVEEFRGARAHNFDWLRHRYHQTNAAPFPRDISESLVLIGTWDPALRYEPGLGDRDDARRFCSEVGRFVEWSEGLVG